ncbi:MAG: glycosyl transferase, group 2 family [Firmicutes bacterium]|nr:glycosyl transferase, group 2 family [Bacillota bacterium]
MNDKTICFITCTNNRELYNKCLEHINKLIMPDGYTIDIVAIEDAKSITSGYNRAMVKSDAKYKVYLHQDTYIINENFISDILDIFQNAQIGMIGMVGAANIPYTGAWGDSKHRYGKVIESSHLETKELALLEWDEVVDAYQLVKCIDGLIMITQYDIQWREDIFDGWDYYDASQSVEFCKAGYHVCVPKQNEPWCIHDCGNLNLQNFDKYRDIFLKVYARDLYTVGNLMPILYKLKKKLRLCQKKVEMFVKGKIKSKIEK